MQWENLCFPISNDDNSMTSHTEVLGNLSFIYAVNLILHSKTHNCKFFKGCPTLRIAFVSWVCLQTLTSQTFRPGRTTFRAYKYLSCTGIALVTSSASSRPRPLRQPCLQNLFCPSIPKLTPHSSIPGKAPPWLPAREVQPGTSPRPEATGRLGSNQRHQGHHPRPGEGDPGPLHRRPVGSRRQEVNTRRLFIYVI